MSLMEYLHTLFPSGVFDQFNYWHILLLQYLYLIFTCPVFEQLGNWDVLLPRYLHKLFPSGVFDQFNYWHIPLPEYLHLIFTYRVFDQSSNWSVLLPRYLQTFVSIVVSADVIIKLSKDIYKTRVLQKNRKGLLELNWAVHKWIHEKKRLGFDTHGAFFGEFGITQIIIKLKQVVKVLRWSEQRISLKLKNIYSPDWEPANLELADIVDTQMIQYLMNDFYKLVPISLGLNDLKGNVLVGIGWQDICTKFHRAHPETCRHCVECNIKLSEASLPGKFKIYRCKNNMWDMAAPIMVDDWHVGDIYAGQFFFEDEPVDYNFFRSQARQQGFNEEEYIAALEKVPRLSREDVDKAIDFILTFNKVMNQKHNIRVKELAKPATVVNIPKYSFENQIPISEFYEDD